MRFLSVLLMLSLAACGAGPVGGELVITPAEPNTLDEIVAEIAAEATASNANREVIYEWSWWKDGERQPGLDDPTLPASLTARGQEWSVQALPFDGRRYGEPLIASVEIGNAPPSARVTLEPLTPTSAHDLVATASGTDPDGDEVEFRYVWYRSGAIVQAATEPVLDAALTRRNQTWKVQVIPSDGLSQGRPAEAEVTIRNAPPSGGAVAIAPVEPFASDDLICELVTPAVDPDSDPIAYTFAWRRNGAAYLGETARTVHDGDTVPTASTAEDEVWSCAATPSDDEASGPEIASPTVTIQPDPVAIFHFVDTTAIDLGPTALRDFFQANPVGSSDYIFFEVRGGSSGGAWCAERADWYASNYVNFAGGSSNITSGSWQKWHRSTSGAWSGPVSTTHLNYFGTGCASSAWNWCSEWGLGGRFLGVMPGRFGGETYAGTFSGSGHWEFTLRLASDRFQACGF